MRAFLLVLVLALGACGATGPLPVPKPETPFERMAALEASWQGALETVDRLIDAGIVDIRSAEDVATAVRTAGDAMRAARQAHRSGAANSAALVSAANSAVLSLIRILREKEQEADARRPGDYGSIVWSAHVARAGQQGCVAAA